MPFLSGLSEQFFDQFLNHRIFPGTFSSHFEQRKRHVMAEVKQRNSWGFNNYRTFPFSSFPYVSRDRKNYVTTLKLLLLSQYI